MDDKKPPLKGVRLRTNKDNRVVDKAYNPKMIRKKNAKTRKPPPFYKRNSVDSILNFLAGNVQRNTKDETLLYSTRDFANVNDVDEGRLVLINEAFRMATREIEKEKQVKCKKCGSPVRIKIPSAEHDKNKVASIKMLLDKIVPSLKQVEANVTQSTFDTGKFCELIGPSIARFVSIDKQEEAISDIQRILLQCGYNPMNTRNDNMTKAERDSEPDYTVNHDIEDVECEEEKGE